MDLERVWAVFFSPTGTTRKIVTAIAESIANRVTVGYDEFDFTLPEARKTGRDFYRDDLIVFGVPVYAGRVPNVLLKYLDTLKGNSAIAIPVVLFGNRHYDDALIELRDILEKDGFHTIAAAAFVGEHSFSTIIAGGRPDAADMAIAGEFADKVAGRLASISPAMPVNVPGNPYPYMKYYQPRDAAGNPMDIRKVKPLTGEDCNDCKICTQVCPMGSINYDNVRESNGICIKCCACIKKCPLHARYFDDGNYLYHKQELEERLTGRVEPELFV